jgi:hypothetical protein
MRIVMDADALIKLTRAGAKEAMAAVFDVVLPEAVQRETTSDRFPDGLLIAQNIQRGRLQVHVVREVPLEAAVLPAGGERDVFALHRSLGDPAARIVSDDRRLIKRLAMLSTPVWTPGVVLVALVERGGVSRAQARRWLEALRATVSADEYVACSAALEEGIGGGRDPGSSA